MHLLFSELACERYAVNTKLSLGETHTEDCFENLFDFCSLAVYTKFLLIVLIVPSQFITHDGIKYVEVPCP